MARSMKEDPVEKFRFKITVISLDILNLQNDGFDIVNIQSTVETIAGLTKSDIGSKISLISRAGFQFCGLPKANVGEISYRENVDNQRFSKIPGLVKYDPITLSRGVTANRDLYEWYRLVNEEIGMLSVANEQNADLKYGPLQSNNFRKDVIIEVLDRKGDTVKSWYLFNAWPIVYQPGNDLAANSDEKLIESLTLTYEFFIELKGGLSELDNEIAKAAGMLTADIVIKELNNLFDT